MSGLAVVLIIIFIIVIFVFFQVMVTIGEAGLSPSKLIADIFKKNTEDKIDLRSKVKMHDIAPVGKDGVNADGIESNHEMGVSDTIRKWRLAAGILFSLVMTCLLTFYRPALMSCFTPWVPYIFCPLLITTTIVFIILRRKEQKQINTTINPDTSTTRKTNREKILLLIAIFFVIGFVIYKICQYW